MKEKSGEKNLKWQAIEKDYKDLSLSIKEVCQRHNIKRSELYKHAREEAWQLRSKKKKANQQKVQKLQEKNSRSQEQIIEAQQPVTTLEDALEFITMDLMQRIKMRSQECDADHDKDARTLSSLVRTYEKLQEIKTDTHISNKSKALKKKGEQTNFPDQKINEDAKRREIATNLEKLIQGL